MGFEAAAEVIGEELLTDAAVDATAANLATAAEVLETPAAVGLSLGDIAAQAAVNFSASYALRLGVRK